MAPHLGTVVGIREGTIIAALVGAVVSLKFVPGSSLWQRLTSVVSGAVIASYVSPFVIAFFKMSDGLESSVAFMIGLFGMSIAGAVVDQIPLAIRAAKEKFIG